MGSKLSDDEIIEITRKLNPRVTLRILLLLLIIFILFLLFKI